MKMRKGTNRGMSMLYVLAALIVTGFVGTAMLKISTGDRMSNANYSTSASARSAAKSGLIYAIQQFEDQTNSEDNLTLLNKIVGDSLTDDDPWYVRDTDKDDDYFTLPGIGLEAKVKILAFDKDRHNITLNSEGKGKGGARASIVAVYHLDGLGFEEVDVDIDVEEVVIEVVEYDSQVVTIDTTEVVAKTNWGNENAIFMGDGLTLLSHEKYNVNGSVYVGAGANLWFDAQNSGSTFNGNFIVREGANIRIDGAGTSVNFNGPSYFGSRITFTGSQTLNFSKKAGFEKGVQMEANNYIKLGGTSYWNSPNYTEHINSNNEIKQNNNRIYHNGQFNYKYIKDYGWGSFDWYIKTHGGPEPIVVSASQLVGGKVDIPDSLDIISKQCEIHVNPEVISESVKTYWDKGKTTPLSGTAANTMYGNLNDDKLWNGFMVLSLRSDLVMKNSGTFTGKMIILLNGNSISPVADGNGVISCNSSANITIIANGGWIENFVSSSHYRGLIWGGSGSKITIGSSNKGIGNMTGSLYALPGCTFEWGSATGQTSSIKFDPTVLEELDNDGFITKENCATATNGNNSGTTTTIDTTTTTNTVTRTDTVTTTNTVTTTSSKLVQTKAVILASLISQSI